MPQKRRSSGVRRGPPVGRRVPGNRLLAALPPEEFARLAPHLTEIQLEFRRSLYKGAQPVRHVCFPDAGVCSIMAVMRDGATAEVATVGNEGMTGLALYFGAAAEPNSAIAHVPGFGRLLPADVFRREMARRGVLRELVGEYAHARMLQAMQSAACAQLHSLEQRACRWLLMTHDRVESDSLTLTHELFGLILGARRPTVTLIAANLHRAGLIDYRHGHVTIADRQGLEAKSCECYGVVRTCVDGFVERTAPA